MGKLYMWQKIGKEPHRIWAVKAEGTGDPNYKTSFDITITKDGVTTNESYAITKTAEEPDNNDRYFCNAGATKNGTATFTYIQTLTEFPDSADDSAGALAESDSTPYTLNIDLSDATVNDLIEGNYNLYGFKAVKASQGNGRPLVWFQTDEFSPDISVNWTTQYQAFTTRKKIIPNGTITASYSTNINLGQTLEVDSGGKGPVKGEGPAIAISIHNTTQTQFTCGISEMQDSVPSPLCAFPLYGLQTDVMVPIQKVLLMFSTTPVNTGTVIEQAYSPGILIDLTSDNTRDVSYDINGGWSWGGFAWAQQIKANQDLVPLLIESPSHSFKRRLREKV